MSLGEYKKKRSFAATPEPKGSKETKKTKQLRFVIHKHDATHLHYDLRLEMEGVLKSWAIPKEPSLDPKIKRLAIMVEDHPLDYIDFQGTIPKGNYGAGNVSIWDKGFYHSSETTDQKENEKKLKAGLQKGGMHFLMYGNKLKGLFSLIKVKNNDQNSWLLIKHNDGYTEHTDSTREQIPKRTMPHDIKPMLATPSDRPFDDPNWIFEVKWDGYRAIAEIENGNVKLYSRNGTTFTKKYAPVTNALKKIRENVVLDGEIIAPDKQGRHSFQSLQNYEKEPSDLQYVIFDILYKDQQDLHEIPLLERKKILKKTLPKSTTLVYGDYVAGNGINFFNEAKKLGLEGIIAKDLNSTYKDGTRGTSWLKIKNINTQEAIICGFTEPKGSRMKFGALILGVYKDSELVFIGHTGSGFDESSLKKIHQKLLPLTQSKSPFKTKIAVNGPVTWVRPKLVGEIKFAEWTMDGHLRQPIFLGLREDKDPSEVIIDTPQEKTGSKTEKVKTEEPKSKQTNLDKIYWPKEGYTKGDVVEYYKKIAPTILPYLKDRPQNLNRHPNGIDGENFYQKNFEVPLPDFIETREIWSESNGKNIRYLLCQNTETLLYLANLGCIEINPWSSKVQSLDRPDYMIFDLDPGKNSFEKLIKVAQVVHEVLLLACEKHYCKTSGKSGMHILVPLGAQYDYNTIKTFAEMIMNIVHKKMPDITSLERKPEKRGGKIYLDFLQNRSGQTIAAPYSLRPWPNATVSTPLSWQEVKNGLDPNKFTIKTIFERIKKKGDLWKTMLNEKVDLEKSIKCLQDISDYIK